MKTISIIVPVYNEEENVQRAHERVTAVMTSLRDKYDYEIVFTDNHSTDRTFEILEALAKKDKHLRLIRFSRNFGYQRSILTGYLMSSGEAVVQVDCDLQDPPELIPEFLEKWEQGYAVVYGVRQKRQEGFLISTARKWFYRLINALSEDPLPHDAGDFRLIDRKLIDEMGKYYDYSPYLRGTVAAMGFEQIGIPFERDRRQAGTSSFSLRSYVRLAVDGILNHSVVPLRLATAIGLCGFIISLVLLLGYLIGKLVFGAAWPPGFATIVLLLILGISLNSLFLGIIGEYIARIYQQVKKRPVTIIEKTINIEDRSTKTGRIPS